MRATLFLCPFSAYIASTAYAVSFPSLPRLIYDCAKLRLVLNTWVSPADVRACMYGVSFQDNNRQNILDVITKTLAFHASTNYQVHAPQPFDKDIEWDLVASLEKMRNKSYESDFEFHQDVRQSIMQVKDGHLMYTNGCYEGVYITYNPFPLVLLTDPSDGSQAIHIAPNAHEIASTTLGKEVRFWEKHLGKPLQAFSGARIIQIDGKDPFLAVDNNAQITGVFQGLSSRQNSFFSTAVLRYNNWGYRLGDFAEHTLPLVDSVDLTIQRVGTDVEEKITVPYRSKFNAEKNIFERANHEGTFCRSVEGITNGRDLSKRGSRKIRESVQPTEGVLPEPLQPRLKPLDESAGSTQFYALNNTTGVLVMGDFGGNDDENDANCRLFRGLRNMNETGIDKLIIDLTDNAGGYVCVAHFLHRLLFGETKETYPQPGLDTTLRMPNIAQNIIKGTRALGKKVKVLYQREWRNATHQFIEGKEWFKPITNITINNRQDSFSQRLGMECPMSNVCQGQGEESLDSRPLFRAENIILLSDGRCGSSCALFSVLLAKKHNVTTVVVGGKSDVPQQYCGFVGGESVPFTAVDDALKTTNLKTGKKDPPDIPPDFTVNGKLTITWRLAYGVDKPNEPEEWQDHTARMSLPLTAEMAHNPQNIWEAVAREVFPVTPKPQTLLQVQLP